MRDWLAERGYDPKFGARPLNRLITNEIGNGLAQKIIRGEIKMGQTAEVKIRTDGEGLDVIAVDTEVPPASTSSEAAADAA